jgi:hypothetical protein
MDKDQDDEDKLQKALLKKDKETFRLGDFVFGAILLALVLVAVFIAEHIANWMYFYD